MSFASLGLSEALARAVEAAGYTQPTPVQQRAIPAVLQGRDLMVAAQTGTGKTGGFALPVLERLFPAGHPDREHRHGPRQTRVLVLTPTRELAAQVHDSFRLYARDLPLVSTCIFGGVGMNPQVQALSKGVDVLVACPGRLLDLAQQKAVDLSHVEILVLDEADRMLDMGFIHDVKKVLARLPAQRQNLLFSATFSKDITDLADKLLHNPERIEVTPPNTTVERIEQAVYRIAAAQKRALLAHLITLGAWEQVLVFTRTKHGANRLAEYLCKQGLPAAAIHGNKSQNARTKALADFKANAIRILVATDIAARGLDIDQLPHVVNYELPNVEEDYVHRIGRTGRAGRSGEAISLVAPDEEKLLKAIERLTRQRIPDGDLLGFDPASVVEAPSSGGEDEGDSEARGQRHGHGRGRKDRPVHEGQRKGGKADNAEAAASAEAGEKARKPRRGRGDKPAADKPADKPAEGRGRNARTGGREAQAEKGDKPRGEGRARNKPRAEGAERPAGQGQQRSAASTAGGNTGRNRRGKAAIQTAPGELPLPAQPDRDPEAFLDDDYDNFGNSVDYVSPYQGRGRPGNRQGSGNRPQAQGKRQSGAGQAGGQAAGARRGGGRKAVPSLMSDAPLREPGSTPAVRGSRDSQPVILHKPSRHERLPNATQLEELEQLERLERQRGEKPALLTRNK